MKDNPETNLLKKTFTKKRLMDQTGPKVTKMCKGAVIEDAPKKYTVIEDTQTVNQAWPNLEIHSAQACSKSPLEACLRSILLMCFGK